MPRSLTSVVLLLLTCGLAACSGTPPAPAEYLDRDTGATVTSVAEPFLFSRGDAGSDVRQLDYITLVAVDVNRNARHEQLLLAYFWTTLQGGGPARGPPPLRILAGGEPMVLAPEPGSARDSGIATLPHRPSGGFASEPVVYRTDAATWRRIAAASAVELELPAPLRSADGAPLRYQTWTDGAPALRELLETLQLR